MQKILITGAVGQIGSELTRVLRQRLGASQVIATDRREAEHPEYLGEGPFEILDVMEAPRLMELIQHHRITTIYHLAALLSAVGERRPMDAWKLNVDASLQLLEVARQFNIQRVFIPSSIAAFGSTTPLDQTPQDTIQRPSTMYGITKVTMELLGDYYSQRYKLDCRGVRLPGVISYRTPPGGGTTDYAVEMFHYALLGKSYTCYLRSDTSLDMVYMPDALDAIIGVTEAPSEALLHRNSFNVTAMQFTPAMLAAEIKKHLPGFVCSYEPEALRQGIADSWPNSMDDSAARKEWGWAPKYDLSAMVADMITQLREIMRSKGENPL